MVDLTWALLLTHLGLAAALVPDLLLRRKEPVATLAWLQGILLLPGLGAALYLVFGTNTIQRRRYLRRKRVRGLTPRLAPTEEAIAHALVHNPSAAVAGVAAETLALAIATSRRSPTRGNRLTVFENPSHLYDELEGAVAAARRHVHFEYYIFQPDATGQRFLDLLAQKARQGVEVRLLLDAVGSRRLGSGHLGPLLEAGGRVEWFLPLRLFPPRFAVHLRNHRKIAVVDGAVAFTGGANVGDEYRGRWARRPSWRDTHLKVEGPAVHHLHEVFAEDWYFTAGEDLLRPAYFPPQATVGDAVVQVVASGPDDPARAIHATLFHAIASARERVWIATPYFIPDGAIATALATSALRGVDVRLLVPERTDHPLVDRAGESFLPALLEAGVRVYRYEAGMLHSKLVAVDGRWGTLGSANMDIRSFRLNFEVNLLVLSPTLTRELEEIVGRDLHHSSPYTRSHVDSTPLHRRITVAACRLLAPVL
ncbi:MAG: cardiolipin synthase [Deferrisomatales bacterium]